MSNDQYGFNSREDEHQVRKVSPKVNPGENVSARAGRRATELAAWWTGELTRQLRRYQMVPNSDRKATLNTLLDQYAQQVNDGTFKPPRFSL